MKQKNVLKMNQIGMALLHEVHAPLKVIVHKTHELAAKNCIRLADLQGFTIMTINSDYDIQNRVERLLQRNGIYAQHRLGDGEFDIMIWLIQNQNVISFFAGPEERIPSDTVMLNIEDLDFPWSYYVYGREGKLPKAAYEMLKDIRTFQKKWVRIYRDTIHLGV